MSELKRLIVIVLSFFSGIVCFFATVYGLLLTGMNMIAWFIHVAPIFDLNPSISFYAYIRATKTLWFVTALVVGGAGLYLIFGKPLILDRMCRRWNIKID